MLIKNGNLVNTIPLTLVLIQKSLKFFVKTITIQLHLIILLMLTTNTTYGQQNLVPNGDFELYDTCPQTADMISNAIGWYMPTLGTSDYYNACAPDGGMSVPNNFIGFQYAKSGVGYAGLWAFGGGSGFPVSWEYIQRELSEPLTAGQTYRLCFYASLADHSDYAISQIGANFSTTAISSNNWLSLPYTPQIQSPDNVFISNAMNWTLISGTYIATGGEKYITIGNFKDSLTINFITIDPMHTYGSYGAYYYIDDVELALGDDDCYILPLSLPNVFTPNNDGNNDNWQISNTAEIHVFIYDRWGTKIYEQTSKQISWDGRTNAGEMCTDGVYYYILEQNSTTLKDMQKKGFIQLTR